MNRPVNHIHSIASSPWTAIAGTFASIGGLVWVAGDHLQEEDPQVFSFALFCLISFIFVAIGMYSISVRAKNVSLQNMTRHIHDINHLYRDTLHDCFSGNTPITDQSSLLEKERVTIRAVCQRIQQIYTPLIGRDCTITTKLITKDKDTNKRFCTKYVRSQDLMERDRGELQHYAVGTGQNTALDESLRMAQPGNISHFFSPDLTKEKNYVNQRSNWETFYRSTIIVPIRSATGCDNENTPDDLGFLCIDTLARNRLNDGYHLQLLAAFADQMYNFFSLMRGSYNALAESRQESIQLQNIKD